MGAKVINLFYLCKKKDTFFDLSKINKIQCFLKDSLNPDFSPIFLLFHGRFKATEKK